MQENKLISVKDKTPEAMKGDIYSEDVLAFDEDSEYFYIAVYVPHKKQWLQEQDTPCGPIFKVTHWMDLPPIPVPEEG
jgi:hypothetical protein